MNYVAIATIEDIHMCIYIKFFAMYRIISEKAHASHISLISVNNANSQFIQLINICTLVRPSAY